MGGGRGMGRTADKWHMKARRGKRGETASSPGGGQQGSHAGSDCGMQGGGSTFDLLSGWDTPSSLPSALRGVDSFDSPGDIISARPIEASGEQERVKITLGMHQGTSHLAPTLPLKEGKG